LSGKLFCGACDGVAYPISYRQLEKMMQERGVLADHSTVNRWVIKYAPEFEKAFPRRQCPVGRSWRLDETYVKIKGKWAYLYRAVDKEGHTILRRGMMCYSNLLRAGKGALKW
jgi:putative transposase